MLKSILNYFFRADVNGNDLATAMCLFKSKRDPILIKCQWHNNMNQIAHSHSVTQNKNTILKLSTNRPREFLNISNDFRTWVTPILHLPLSMTCIDLNVHTWYSPIFYSWHLIKSFWPVHSVWEVELFTQVFNRKSIGVKSYLRKYARGFTNTKCD